jgi:PAS domain S-box-containing protein
VYVDADERYRYVSRAYRHQSLAPHEMLGRTVSEVLGPFFYGQLRPWFARALAGERVVFDVVAPQPDGGTRVFETTLVPHLVEGRVRGFLGTSLEVTERQGRFAQAASTIDELHQKTKALAESEARFRQLFESSPLGILLGDSGGRILRVNAALARMLGRTPEELTGSSSLDITHPDDRDHTRGDVVAIDTGSTDAIDVEKRYLHADGHEIWAHTIVSRLVEPSSETPLVVALIEDITEKRALRARALETQKLQAIGALAGGVAHDFNNLLTSLNAHVEGLRSAAPDAPDRAARLDDLDRLHARAAELTQKLLAFARRQVLQAVPLDLNALVLRFASLAPHVLGQHIHLETDLAPALPAVDGDASQLEQVLLNLAENARDAMPAGGVLRLSTRHVAGHGATDLGRVELRVTDTGVGIAAADLPRVFEPFFTTKPLGRGTGLGLPVAQGIVGQHRGTITLESREGAGTTARVVLPASAHLPTSESPPAPVERRAPYETILLAEDDPELRYLVQRMLERGGYHVWPAADGEEACTLFAARPDEVSAAVLDVVMPRMGGLETCETLRRLRPDLPVLFVSGYAQDLSEHGVTLDAFTAFRAKPFASEQLLAAVRALRRTPSG